MLARNWKHQWLPLCLARLARTIRIVGMVNPIKSNQNLRKVRSKKKVIDEARTKGAKVHFASLMDICHLKKAELESKHQKYKGRVVLRGRMETGEVKHEKAYASPRPPPKISLKHDWMKELGSEVVRQPEGEVAQQSKSSESSQPNPNPDQDRTGKPVICPQRGASRSQEIETRSFREEAVKHDGTVKPVVCRDENHEHPTVVCSEQTTHPRFSREGQNLILEEETNHDRTGKPVVCRDTDHEHSIF